MGTQKVFDLIMENCLDANILGMESICALTDVNHSSHSVVFQVSSEILSSNRNILTKIMSIVTKDTIFNTEEDYVDIECYLYPKLRGLALTVIVNILNLSKIDSNFINIIRSQPLLLDDILSVLVRSVKNPRGRFTEATIAAKGLSVLLSSELHCSVKQKLQQTGGVAALDDAHDYGVKYHSLLASETESCLNSFECH